MKDLDFDELDKAVNSLMKTAVPAVTPAGPVTPIAAPVAVSSPATAPDVSAAAPVEPVVNVPQSPVVETPATPIAPAERKTPVATPLVQPKPGRFMDVMHPSADMRSNEKTTIRPSRTGVSLAPLNQTTVSEPVKSDIPAPDVEEPEAEPKSDSSWADPLDFQPTVPVPPVDKEPATKSSVGLLAEEEKAPKSEPNTTSDASSSFERELAQVDPAAPIAPDVSGESEPTSPFLTDAKVEKRPLGSPTPAPETVAPPAEAPKDTSKPKPSLPIPTLPGSIDVEPATTEDNEKTASQPILPIELGKEITAIEADNPALHHATASAAEPPAAASPTFITQQYKEKASSGDQEHAAIYDNNTQPLAHPAKKKSGWGAVAWIFIVILIFVGAAAAFYFLKII